MYIYKEDNLCKYENLLLEKGYRLIGGIDEAGRGALAGPVVAACVVLDPENLPGGIRDSKKLTATVREKLYYEIVDTSISYGVGIVAPDIIDKINIYEATKLAMKNAISNMKVRPDFVIIDAVKLPDLPIMSISITKGEEKSISVAAASIIAKVTRDKILVELHKSYPVYNFVKNKGYPTIEHRKALLKYGPADVHRFSYKPVLKAVKREIL